MIVALVTVLLTATVDAAAVSTHDADALRWADAAIESLNILHCPETPSYCLGDVHKSNITVYVASPTTDGRLIAVSADGATRRSGSHDAVLMLDPSPATRFAHPVFLFYIDIHISRQQCRSRFGHFLEGGECIQLGVRRRCFRWRSGRRWRGGCRPVYPPEVRASRGSVTDRLECRPLPGFSQSCPKPRPTAPPAVPCDPLATNGGCDSARHATHCPFMQSCHHAILISGGWNARLADETTLQNVVSVKEALKNQGFEERAIKTFYADGLNKVEQAKYPNVGEVLPAGAKLTVRYHLRTVCESPRCADTLLVYLNSPTRPDGAMLLWDTDGNAEYDETEVYTIKELLRDIQACTARRLVIIADQKYSDELVKAVYRSSKGRPQIMAIGSDGLGWDELTQRLVTAKCLPNIDTSLPNVTLAGLTCGEKPPLRGCHNLSTLDMLEPHHDDDY